MKAWQHLQLFLFGHQILRSDFDGWFVFRFFFVFGFFFFFRFFSVDRSFYVGLGHLFFDVIDGLSLIVSRCNRLR